MHLFRFVKEEKKTSLDVSQSGAAFRFAVFLLFFFLFPGWFCSHMSIWDVLRGTTGAFVQSVTNFFSREKLDAQIWTQFGTECTMHGEKKEKQSELPRIAITPMCHCRARQHRCSQHPPPNDQVTFSLWRISVFNKICPTSVAETTRAHPNVSPLASKPIWLFRGRSRELTYTKCLWIM